MVVDDRSWFLDEQPGDGTRYMLHVTVDHHGGYLVAWKDALMFWWTDAAPGSHLDLLAYGRGKPNKHTTTMVSTILDRCIRSRRD